MSDPSNYTIGWISAIEIEYIAAQAFLDERHKGPKRVNKNDENHYTLGRIGDHNVVITVLPRGDNGIAAAAIAAKDMMHTFPNVRVCLMVGIGGGAPSKRHDIRLGDVVVSIPTFIETSGNLGGVVQYDYGRTIQERRFQGARYMNQPDKALRNAANGLSAKYKSEGNNIDTVINDILAKNEKLQKEYSRPDPDSDKLYSSDAVQTLGPGKDLASELIERPKRSEKEDNPAIHYGLIASADGFMEDAQIRDILAEELDVLCFEMEAAGLMNSFPCLVIRGICDYSDRHWFKEWRGYAAMTAAAYAKALLEMVPVREVNTMQTINDLVPPDLMERARSFIAPFWGDKKKEAVSVSVIADPEETRTKDRSKDQMPPTPAQSPIMGGVEPKETQANGRSKDQPHQKHPNRTAVAQSPTTGDFDNGKAQLYRMPPNQTTKTLPAKNGSTSSQTEIKDVYIAVMGVTGAGKSSLISLCTGKNVKIGHNLESCTIDVEDVEFMLNDHVCVHLIDTPGFDDTSRSDVEVLQNIADWLKNSYERGTQLSGLIYLHRIIDIRMAGSAWRNLSMFKKLCGEEAYSSVVLATSMWNQVDEAIGAQRERELIETPKFWGIMHKNGSKIFRLNQTRESCLEVIRHIVSLGSTTILGLQDEIVNQGRQIEDTEAGVQLNEDIIRERKKHEAELLALKTQMKEEMEQQDAEMRRLLKEECDVLEENIRRSDVERAKLKQDLKEVHERKEREFLELRKQMEEKQEAALRQQAEKHEDRFRLNEERNRRQMDSLTERMRYTEEVSRKHEEALQRQAQEDEDRAKSWAEHRDTPLHLAARQGKANVVQKLLTQGANIEAKDKYGGTPFYDAVYGGKADIAELLLHHGANIDAPRDNGHTALHQMAAEGRVNMVNFLLDHGANIEAKNDQGDTTFGLAIWNEKADLAKLLLRRGADIEAQQNDHGCTELHIMAYHGKMDMVKFLLDSGADIEAKRTDYSTPLYSAIWNGKNNVANLLLNRGANIEARQNNQGDRMLHLAAYHGEMDMVKFLLDSGADIEAKRTDYSTPLYSAIWNGKNNVANLLLNRGANIEARQNNQGDRMLHLAAYHGKVDIVEFLLNHGANIGAENKNGHTPLAVSDASMDRRLRDRGARG